MNPKLFIGIPTYKGPEPEFLISILDTQAEFLAAKQKIQILPMARISDPEMVRNAMSALFLMSDFSHFMFIDDDLEWKGSDLLRMWRRAKKYDTDILCGAYRHKEQKVMYTLNFLGFAEEHWNGPLLQILHPPGGFTLIHRRVFEGIKPNCEYLIDTTYGLDAAHTYNFFGRTTMNNRRLSEDFAFGQRAIEAGFRIWLDPDVNINHHGHAAFKGNIRQDVIDKIHLGAPGQGEKEVSTGDSGNAGRQDKVLPGSGNPRPVPAGNAA